MDHAGVLLDNICRVWNSLSTHGSYSIWVSRSPVETNISLPAAFDVVETGSYESGSANHSVHIESAKGKIQLEAIPSPYLRYFAIGFTGIMILVLGVVYYARLIMLNVNRGNFFDQINIKNLKRISYTLLLLWVYTMVVNSILGPWVASSMKFTSVDFNSPDLDISIELPLFAAAFWALSHIFSEGARLQREQELTI